MAKAPIVSKAELDASEYTNLRDYLNAKRGLTRKGGEAPEYKPGREGKDSELGQPMTKGESAASMGQFGNKTTPPTKASSGMQADDMAAAMRKGYKEADDAAEEEKGTTTKFIPKDPPFLEKYFGRPSAEKRAANRESVRKALGFKKGGSVSSASKRADGCATKGKTRGRMV